MEMYKYQVNVRIQDEDGPHPIGKWHYGFVLAGNESHAQEQLIKEYGCKLSDLRLERTNIIEVR